MNRYPPKTQYKWLREVLDWGGSITLEEIKNIYRTDVTVFEQLHRDGYLKSEINGYLITDQGREFIAIYKVMES